MAKSDTYFNSETGSIAGRKGGKISKRPPLDKKIKESFEKFIEERIKKGDNRTRLELMIESAWMQFCKGNSKPLQYLIDRGFGKAVQPLSMIPNNTDPSLYVSQDPKDIARIESEIEGILMLSAKQTVTKKIVKKKK